MAWSLEAFSCRRCGLQGQLPAGWNLPTLRALELPGNNLTGGLHAVVAGSGALQVLNLAANKLNDTLSDAMRFDALPALDTVDLSGNPLGGSVPASEALRGGLPNIGSTATTAADAAVRRCLQLLPVDPMPSAA
jgi:hypothetical protein